MAAYYNDNEPACAAWLENLVAAGRISAGRVDARSILEVSADELADFAQVHLFAGIGGWPHALDLVGWPDDEPVWTASCPCQPFSSAGQRRGVDDDQHLWPAVRHLVDELRPPALFGEQVASPLGRSWLAGVRADLEGLGYRVCASDLPAASVGAPHIRQRLYFAAYRLADSDGRDTRAEGLQRGREHRQQPPHGRDSERMAEPKGIDRRSVGPAARNGHEPRERGEVVGLADPEGIRRRVEHASNEREAVREVDVPRDSGTSRGDQPGGPRRNQRGVRLGDADGERRQGRQAERRRHAQPTEVPGAWDDSEWIGCADGKARRVGSGVFPLADGVPGRVVRLRAYGNAIVPPLAAVFIAAAEEARAEAMTWGIINLTRHGAADLVLWTAWRQ